MSEFVGSRLALARAFQRVTLKELADAVSASLGLIGHYEKGLKKNPKPDLVAALAEALKVRAPFFFEPPHELWREEECSFRRRAATPQGIKRRARAHGTLMDLVLRELATMVKFPKYAIPSIQASDTAAIERAADQCREAWGLGFGPIPHIGRVAEKNGAILVQHFRHADKIDAFSRRGTHSIIVLNTSRKSTSRWVFDVAHELGHFVLHKGIRTGSKATEDQANAFASALLLPRRAFSREFISANFSWDHVFDLKRRWTTSASAIIRRAFGLSLINPILYRRCYQYMSVKGWLKEEPYEPDFVGPEWLASACNVARDRYSVTPQVLSERLNLETETFTAITGIPVETTTPIQFKPKLVRSRA